MQVCVCSASNAAGLDPPQELPGLLLLLSEFGLEEPCLFLFMRAISVGISWSECQHHRILILQHLFHVVLT